jgi:hypothetical protein
MGFFLITVSRLAMGPTRPPIQRILETPTLGVKRPGREADQSSPSSTEVKNAWSYTSTNPIHLRGVLFSYSAGINLPLPLPHQYIYMG